MENNVMQLSPQLYSPYYLYSNIIKMSWKGYFHFWYCTDCETLITGLDSPILSLVSQHSRFWNILVSLKPDIFWQFPLLALQPTKPWNDNWIFNYLTFKNRYPTPERLALTTELTAVASITKLTEVRSQFSKHNLLTFFVSSMEKKNVPLCCSAMLDPDRSTVGNWAKPGPKILGWTLGNVIFRRESSSIEVPSFRTLVRKSVICLLDILVPLNLTTLSLMITLVSMVSDNLDMSTFLSILSSLKSLQCVKCSKREST